MKVAARPVAVAEIASLRELYRAEMACQIVHDSLHVRPGWTEAHLLEVDGATAGYGSLAVAGPWTGSRVIFEWYVQPSLRVRAFDLFECLVETSRATGMEIQSNDALITAMLHAYAHSIKSESIVFADGMVTEHPANGALVTKRNAAATECVLEVDGADAGNGGILYHYNRPYGDIYMEIAEPFRRRGYGSYLVQELKRICRELGSVPCARCNPGNVASRRTLQKAGFVPCGHILVGTLGVGA